MMTQRSSPQVNYLLAFILILGAQCGVRSFILKQPSFHNQCSLKDSNSYVKYCGSHSSKFPLFYFGNDESGDSDPRESEFSSLEPREDNNIRKNRQEREKLDQGRFAGYGNDLWGLRSKIDDLNLKLIDSMTSGANVEDLKSSLQQAESRDPYLVYGLELEATEKALQEGRIEEAFLHRQEAMSARSCLPQFNFEGLWIGKYGDHGFGTYPCLYFTVRSTPQSALICTFPFCLLSSSFYRNDQRYICGRYYDCQKSYR